MPFIGFINKIYKKKHEISNSQSKQVYYKKNSSNYNLNNFVSSPTEYRFSILEDEVGKNGVSALFEEYYII